MNEGLMVAGLVVRYPNFRVGPVTLSLGVGIHHLRGDNGCGKTTLLRALCGDLRAQEGTVRIGGFDPYNQPAGRVHMGFAPSAPDLPGFWTVDEAWQSLAALRGRPDWDGQTARRSLGLPGHLRLDEASAGQRHRAELLAALAGDPYVLLLDEPMAHLDGRGLNLLTTWFGQWRTNRIVLVTTHAELPVKADSVLELRAGEPLMHTGWL